MSSESNQDNNTQVYQGFTVVTTNVHTETGITTQTQICINQNEQMVKNLQALADLDDFYDSVICISPQLLYPYLKTMQNQVEAGDYSLCELVCFLNDYFKTKIEQLDNMTKLNKINFDNLGAIFTIGTKFVAFVHNNEMVGSIVNSTQTTNSMFGRTFRITGTCIMTVGNKLKQIQRYFFINEFSGVKSIQDLKVRPMNPEDEAFLNARGEQFAKFCFGTHYWEYEGNMCFNTGYNYEIFNANGRIMIDSSGFDQMMPSYFGHREGYEIQAITDDNRFMCWPYLLGFSFSAKRWGEIHVGNLRDIKFDDDAFNYLVLDPQIKKMMKALIVNVKTSFKDIIGGKSGGCIFLLHGPPGVGKTLTCEAVAELLHKPLYSLTVGELGTNVNDLEKQLNKVLVIANSWEAVILLDEADIFMESRSKNDIKRNGMVSIFLRLLERHQGVMFLTTNRNADLDPAFRSRISIVIDYQPLDFDARKQVWKNLLSAASIHSSMEETDIDFLASKEMNGRQIKNVIRMAQSLIMDKDYNPNSNPLSSQEIERIISYI